MSVAVPRRRRADINVVPLVDVMVVLVFFLLLSSRLEVLVESLDSARR